VFLDLITIKFLGTYLTRPMHVFGTAGLVSMGLGLLTFVLVAAMKYLSPSPLFMTGNPLLLLSVMFELVGVQLLSIGLLGELLTRTYFESQGKTPYTVRTVLNGEAAPRRKAA
jgi:hypothetical protein